MPTEKRKKENVGFLRRRKVYAEYLLRRDKYPLPFNAYEVHHKDFNNKNFHTDNLQLLTPKEHNRLHDEHNEGLRRAAEKIEERLEKIKEIQKERKKKRKKKIISFLVVLALIGILILILFLTSKSPKGELPSLGYITIGNSYIYPEDISTLEKANEICTLRCRESFESVVTNFPLHYITCYCKGKKYFVDTRILEDLTSQEIGERERNQ
jgi:predicted nucleic acid-binding Zn ribbon protein